MTTKRIKKNTNSEDEVILLKLKKHCLKQNQSTYSNCTWFRILSIVWSVAPCIIIFGIIAVYKNELSDGAIGLFSIVTVLLTGVSIIWQVIGLILWIIRRRKINDFKSKYSKELSSDVKIIDELSQLYLKESKTNISLVYQFFAGRAWEEAESIHGFFEWNIRAARSTIYTLIYLLPVVILICFGTIYSIFFVHVSSIVAFWIFIIIAVVFTVLWVIAIFDYKKNLAKLKYAWIKYRNSLTLESVDRLIPLCTSCREMYIWNFIGVLTNLE